MTRSCCCTGYLTNPGGRCCMDLRSGYWQPEGFATVPYPPAPVQDGWRCPVCGLVNAPWMPLCSGKHEATVTVTTTTNTAPESHSDSGASHAGSEGERE